ncbi:MAG: hypothetical protein ACRD12_15170 [Acidimicrobiales bacterium]
MGEIFNALEVMNRTMALGLSPQDLLRAEMGFKSELARRVNPDPTITSDPIAVARNYELVAELRPRAQELSLEQLSTFARQEVKKPSTRVNVKTLRQIDYALGALAPPAAAPKKAAPKKSAPKKAAPKKSATVAKAKKAPAKKKG